MTISLPVECTFIDMNIYFGKYEATNSIYLVYYPDSSPFPPEPHAGHSSGFCSDRYNKYKQLCRIPLVMPQFRPCVYCGTTYCNSFKLYRHCLKHLPWFFGSVLCCNREQRFDSKPRLEEHCETKSHKTVVSRKTITPPDIEQLRLKYSELEGSSRGSEFQDFLQNYCVQRKTYTNFDRSDGILDRNLFPEPPRKMDTPVQDDVVADTGRYQGMLPTSFPLMPAQISTVLGEEHSNHLMGIVPDQLDISSESGDHVPDVLPVPATSDTTPVMQGASTSSLEDLPEPPTLKRKRSSPPSATPGEQSQLLCPCSTKRLSPDPVGDP